MRLLKCRNKNNNSFKMLKLALKDFKSNTNIKMSQLVSLNLH